MRISDWSSDVCSSDLFVVTEGELTSGHIDVAEATIGNVIGITDFRVELADGVWSGGAAATATMPGGVDADIGVSFERSDERRVGKEGVSTCRSRRSPYN